MVQLTGVPKKKTQWRLSLRKKKRPKSKNSSPKVRIPGCSLKKKCPAKKNRLLGIFSLDTFSVFFSRGAFFYKRGSVYFFLRHTLESSTRVRPESNSSRMYRRVLPNWRVPRPLFWVFYRRDFRTSVLNLSACEPTDEIKIEVVEGKHPTFPNIGAYPQ